MVAAELMRRGVEVAYPASDVGVDLLAYRLEQGQKAAGKFVPIQVKLGLVLAASLLGATALVSACSSGPTSETTERTTTTTTAPAPGMTTTAPPMGSSTTTTQMLTQTP